MFCRVIFLAIYGQLKSTQLRFSQFPVPAEKERSYKFTF